KRRHMMKLLRLLLLVLLAIHAGRVSATSSQAASPQIVPRVNFMRVIQPILSANCYKCHGPKESKNGLRLDRRRDALEGGDSGAVIIPGKSEESRLIRYVTGENDQNI